MKIWNKVNRDALLPALILVIIMWIVFWADYVLPYNLNSWGIHPEKPEGLWGIIFSPILHGSLSHIMSNSVPMLILGFALYFFYKPLANTVLFTSWIVVGILVWISGISGVHIGMSGVIYALASFLFFSGLIRKYKPLVGISFFVAFFYGSLVWGILPLREGVSWQGHLWGGVIGMVLAIYYRKKGPRPPKYQYEIEEAMGIESDMPIEVESIAEEKRKWAEENTLNIQYHYQPKENPKQEDE